MKIKITTQNFYSHARITNDDPSGPGLSLCAFRDGLLCAAAVLAVTDEVESLSDESARKLAERFIGPMFARKEATNG